MESITPSSAAIGPTVDSLLTAAITASSCGVAFPGERWSARQISARAEDYAALLVGRGLAQGSKVAIWLPPSFELLAALFGTMRAGCVAVPVSDRFRAAEVRHVITTADVVAVVTTDEDTYLDRLGVMRQALPGLRAPSSDVELQAAPTLRHVVLAEDTPEVGDGVDLEAIVPNAAAMLIFTSGTSAAAKACIIEHRSLLAQARALAEERYLLDASSVVWSPLPLFHIAGLVALLATMHARATFAHSGVFAIDSTLELLERERPTHSLASFETIWMLLLDEAERRGMDLSYIKVGLSANGKEQLHKLDARLPHVAFMANYGSTEGSGHVAMGRPDEPREVRLAGGSLPLPGAEIRIVGADDGQELGPDDVGEIQFRGAHLFAGYYGDPGADAAAFTPDGWFRSGDLGSIGADGRLTFRGRLKDMLKVGGENVSALEVEAFLTSNPEVNVAAVVGVPDDYYGEVPAAFVELVGGATVSAEELIERCLDNIASFKVPRYVRLVDEWPMSGTKIRKHVLQKTLSDELRAAGIATAPRLRGRSARRSGSSAA